MKPIILALRADSHCWKCDKKNHILYFVGVRSKNFGKEWLCRSCVMEKKLSTRSCSICFGKGYSTNRGEGFIEKPKTNIEFCNCKRGKQLKMYWENVPL